MHFNNTHLPSQTSAWLAQQRYCNLRTDIENRKPSSSGNFPLHIFSLASMAAPIKASTSYFDKNVPKVVLRSLFMKYDKDQSGVLNQTELRELFQGDLGLTKDQAEAYSMMLDKDGNQTVSFEELHQWLSSGEKFQNVNDKSR